MKPWVGLAAGAAQLLLLAALQLLPGSRHSLDGAAIVFAAMSFAVVTAEAGSSRQGEESRASGAGATLAGLSGVVLLSLFAAGWVQHQVGSGLLSGGTLRVVVGALCMGVGGVLRVLAIRTLGAQFTSSTDVPAGQVLCTHGPYAFDRHPSEHGLLLLSAGAALVLGSSVALAIWVLGIVPTSVLRVRREERSLREAFPLDYAAYERKVASASRAWRRAD